MPKSEGLFQAAFVFGYLRQGVTQSLKEKFTHAKRKVVLGAAQQALHSETVGEIVKEETKEVFSDVFQMVVDTTRNHGAEYVNSEYDRHFGSEGSSKSSPRERLNKYFIRPEDNLLNRAGKTVALGLLYTGLRVASLVGTTVLNETLKPKEKINHKKVSSLAAIGMIQAAEWIKKMQETMKENEDESLLSASQVLVSQATS